MPEQFPAFSRENFNMKAREEYYDRQRQKELENQLKIIRATADAEKQRQIDVKIQDNQNALSELDHVQKLAEDKKAKDRETSRSGLEQIIYQNMLREQAGTGYRFPGAKAMAEQHSGHMLKAAEALPALKAYTDSEQLGSALPTLDLRNQIQNNIDLLTAKAQEDSTVEMTDETIKAKLSELRRQRAIDDEKASNPAKYAAPPITAAETRNAPDPNMVKAMQDLGLSTGETPKANRPTVTPPPGRIKMDSLKPAAAAPAANVPLSTIPNAPSAPPHADMNGNRPMDPKMAEMLPILQAVMMQLMQQSATNRPKPGIAR